LENSCQNRSAGGEGGGSINTKYRPRSIRITEQKRAKYTINNINKLLIVNTDMHSHAHSHTCQYNGHLPDEPVFALACCALDPEGQLM